MSKLDFIFMIKIKLNISERLFSIKIFNEFKGDLETMSHLMSDIKKFTVSEEDWKKANRQVQTVKNEKGEDVTQWSWDDEKGGLLEIEINNKTRDYLLSEIEKMNSEKSFTFTDKAVITLKSKLSE